MCIIFSSPCYRQHVWILLWVICLGGWSELSGVEMGEIECTKEELLSFFPKQIVHKVLLQFKIPAAQAAEIADELAVKNHELIQMVEQRAAALTPNPFKDPTQREKAIQIYQDVLHDVLAQALKSHEIAGEERIDLYLQEIRKVKSQMFVQCIRSQQSLGQPPSSLD